MIGWDWLRELDTVLWLADPSPSVTQMLFVPRSSSRQLMMMIVLSSLENFPFKYKYLLLIPLFSHAPRLRTSDEITEIGRIAVMALMVIGDFL